MLFCPIFLFFNKKMGQNSRTQASGNQIISGCGHSLRHAVVFDRISGKEPDLFDDSDALKIGKLVGQIYRIFDGFDVELSKKTINTEYLIHHAIDDIKQYLPEKKVQIGYLTDIGHRLGELFKRHILHEPPYSGICHGDLHTGNMLKTAEEEIYIFDFDACGFGPRIYDIGVYANNNWTKTTREELDKDYDALNKF